MKGFAPVINVLIIVAVSVIVLTSVIAFYYPSFSSESEVVSLEYVKVSACHALTARYCNEQTNNIQIANFDADKDGIVGESATDGDNLFMLCYNYYQIRCTSQMPGDLDNDCIISSSDGNLYFSVCGGSSPPLDKCDVDGTGGSNCAGPDGDVDVFDNLCIRNAVSPLRGKVSPEAEMNCKKICGCP